MPQSDKDVIRSAIEFWEKLYSVEEATVKFTKKDKTIRIMRCTLDFKKIPKEKHPKKINMSKILKLMQTSGIIHVYDMEKKDWRSVPFKEVDWMELNSDQDQRLKIRPFKR